MIYFPFIYFSFLLIYILLTKKRFELSALITSAYIVTSFFAIVIDYKQLYGAAGCVEATIEPLPTFLYCSLITITILPFHKLYSLQKYTLIPIRNVRLINMIVYFYMIIFLLVILFFGKELVGRMQSQDIGALRIETANGEYDLGFSNYSGIVRIIARLSFLFGSSAMFLHVIYFYSLAFLKRSSWFNLSILVVSTLPIIISMLSFDRSKLVYWLMSFIALAVFFWPSLKQKRKKQIKLTFTLFSSLFFIYLSIITIARYGIQDVGASDSLIVYAGQSFNNFCLFFDKLHYTGINLARITPVLNSIIGSSDVSNAMLNNYAIDTNIFASFCGMMIVEIGVLGTIIYCFIFSIIASLIFAKRVKYNITKIFLVVILLYVPYLGIFGLYYSAIDRMISVWVILLLCYFLQNKFE